jgi:pimeloyl-ACP methyl ester carboxylesterase/class 3 adenylate cyclase
MDATLGGLMAQPTTRYTKVGEVNIAYQVIGDGPVDLVWAWGLASNIDVAWEEPSYAAFLRRLSQFTRLILFDRRGCGASDREGTTATPTLEERMDDVIAVLDAVGSETASILGLSEGGCLAAAFAATYPHRVRSIVLYGTVARFRQDTDHPWGLGDKATLADFVEWMRRGWGTTQAAENAVALWAPSMIGDQRFIAWFAKHCRHSVSRGAIRPLLWSTVAVYLVDVFPAVRVPTLVLHRRDDRLVPIGQGRRIAEQIPNAQFVELPGADHYPFVGDADAVLAEIEGFLLGSPGSWPRRHRLLTVLCTHIAGSAESLHLTQDAWRELTAGYEDMVRNHVSRYGGEGVTSVAHGLLAVFDGPSRAIRCAMSIGDAAARGGLAVRAGLHTGECDVVESDVRGFAVHVASRIAESAMPGQILVSSTVCDLVPGSGLLFGDGQTLVVDGHAGPRSVFPVLGHGAPPETVRRLAIDQANVLRRDGEYWTAAYGGLVVTLRDSKGLRDLARLLTAPRHELHVLDLATPAAAARTAPSVQEALDADLSIDNRSAEPIIDDAARAAYQRRIVELRQDINDAEVAGDGEAAAKARQELDILVKELASAYGLGGRTRRTPDHVERARKAVTRRIRDAVARIDRSHPALGRHLHASVHTGVYCSYAPEQDLVWTVDGRTGQS